MSKRTTSEYFIAYFDILGYSKLVKNLLESEEPKLIKDIHDIVKSIYELKKSLSYIYPIKIYTFSDNFLITMKIRKTKYIDDFIFFVSLLQETQYQIIIYYGLLIRGSLVKGKLYTGYNFVYGKGLILAYDIENNIAITPRIIVDKNLIRDILVYYDNFIIDSRNEDNINEIISIYGEQLANKSFSKNNLSEEKYQIENTFKNYKLRKDIDGNFFIYPLQQIEVDRYRTNYDNNYKIAVLYLDLYIVRILCNLYYYGDDIDVAKKYLWCCAYYNTFCRENGYNCYFDISLLQQKYKDKKAYCKHRNWY
jgi:hypothetical protein